MSDLSNYDKKLLDRLPPAGSPAAIAYLQSLSGPQQEYLAMLSASPEAAAYAKENTRRGARFLVGFMVLALFMFGEVFYLIFNHNPNASYILWNTLVIAIGLLFVWGCIVWSVKRTVLMYLILAGACGVMVGLLELVRHLL